jgi:hypothetical protein
MEKIKQYFALYCVVFFALHSVHLIGSYFFSGQANKLSEYLIPLAIVAFKWVKNQKIKNPSS